MRRRICAAKCDLTIQGSTPKPQCARSAKLGEENLSAQHDSASSQFSFDTRLSERRDRTAILVCPGAAESAGSWNLVSRRTTRCEIHSALTVPGGASGSKASVQSTVSSFCFPLLRSSTATPECARDSSRASQRSWSHRQNGRRRP
jgi:hypothetical protein